MSHAAMNVVLRSLLRPCFQVFWQYTHSGIDVCILIYSQWFCHGAVIMNVNMASCVQHAQVSSFNECLFSALPLR